MSKAGEFLKTTAMGELFVLLPVLLLYLLLAEALDLVIALKNLTKKFVQARALRVSFLEVLRNNDNLTGEGC